MAILQPTQPYINLSVYPSIHLFTHPSNHPLVHSSIHPFTYLSIHPSIHPSVHPSLHTSTHLFTHPSIHSLIHLAIRPSIHSPTCPPIPQIFIGNTSVPGMMFYFSKKTPPETSNTELKPVSTDKKMYLGRGHHWPSELCNFSVRM